MIKIHTHTHSLSQAASKLRRLSQEQPRGWQFAAPGHNSPRSCLRLLRESTQQRPTQGPELQKVEVIQWPQDNKNIRWLSVPFCNYWAMAEIWAMMNHVNKSTKEPLFCCQDYKFQPRVHQKSDAEHCAKKVKDTDCTFTVPQPSQSNAQKGQKQWLRNCVHQIQGRWFPRLEIGLKDLFCSCRSEQWLSGKETCHENGNNACASFTPGNCGPLCAYCNVFW